MLMLSFTAFISMTCFWLGLQPGLKKKNDVEVHEERHAVLISRSSFQ